MRKILAIVLFVSCIATKMMAQDLDSLYARDLLTVGTVAPDLTDAGRTDGNSGKIPWTVCRARLLGIMVP